MTAYLHTKFGLIWIKETKVTEGGRNPPPQVENVLNRPGEIGFKTVNKSEYKFLSTPFLGHPVDLHKIHNIQIKSEGLNNKII